MHDSIRTARLLIRCWQPEDAPLLKEAIDSSLPELQRWVPWAMHEPTPVDALAARLATMRNKFVNGDDWPFGIFDQAETRVLGGTGLHPRMGSDVLEIGYWIRTSETGRGYATEAAEALCAEAFACTGIARVEIHCDAANQRSAAIPRRLGFRLAKTMRRSAPTSHGTHRDTLVWLLSRADFQARSAREVSTQP